MYSYEKLNEEEREQIYKAKVIFNNNINIKLYSFMKY